MTVTIPDEALENLDLSPAQARLELAIALFKEEKITQSRAARIAGLGFITFHKELGRRRIPIQYDVGEFEKDLQTLRRMPSPE